MSAPAEDATEQLAARIAATVDEHPSVHRRHGGEFGAIATLAPGGRFTGVAAGPPVEVGVVLRVDRPLTEVVAELRQRVRQVAGDVPVDITVADIHSEE
jgi:hypothetical protein